MTENTCLFFTITLFADSVGVTKRTVEGWIDRGFIPTVKIGKRRLVNAHAIRKQLDEASDGDVALAGC